MHGGSVLLPDKTLTVLKILPGDAALQFWEQAQTERLSIRICYCSLYGDCWLNDSLPRVLYLRHGFVVDADAQRHTVVHRKHRTHSLLLSSASRRYLNLSFIQTMAEPSRSVTALVMMIAASPFMNP